MTRDVSKRGYLSDMQHTSREELIERAMASSASGANPMQCISNAKKKDCYNRAGAGVSGLRGLAGTAGNGIEVPISNNH
jgi:hypothetical protein